VRHTDRGKHGGRCAWEEMAVALATCAAQDVLAAESSPGHMFAANFRHMVFLNALLVGALSGV
jgi:hypothetical protein